MKKSNVGLVLVVSATLLAGSVSGQPPVKEETGLVGNIFVVGNTITKQSVILDAVPIFPGQPLDRKVLRVAEKNLEGLRIFSIDQGHRPTVRVVDEDSPYKDILVTVRETKTSNVKLMPGLSPDCGVVLALWWEERNFDPFSWPTNLEDLRSGRAFRGGGRLMRLPMLQFPIMPCRLPIAFGAGVLPLSSLSLNVPMHRTPSE